MFNARDENHEKSNVLHLAEMTALLDPPPTDLVQRDKAASIHFDAHGSFSTALSVDSSHKVC